MGKPIKLFWSHEGFDLCVHESLASIKGQLGFQVVESRRSDSCNLPVIERGATLALPPDWTEGTPIHIVNCVVHDMSASIHSAAGWSYSYFAPSEALLVYRGVPERGGVANPPVHTDEPAGRCRGTKCRPCPHRKPEAHSRRRADGTDRPLGKGGTGRLGPRLVRRGRRRTCMGAHWRTSILS